MKYRLNVRFDLEDENQREAANYLKGLSASRNDFIVEAVLTQIRRQQSGCDFTLNDIRNVVRDELRSISVASVETKPMADFTEDRQADNDACVLEALEILA